MKLFFRKLGDGKPLIILHGLFGSGDNWQSLAKQFSVNCTVYLVDMRNHGQSPHSNEMNYDAMCGDLLELYNDEKINSAILLGHSMGGKAAMFFAQKFPNKVSKLIVVDMGVKKYPPHHNQIFDALFAVDFEKIFSRKDAENTIRLHFNDESVIQFLLKNLYWEKPEKLAWKMNVKGLYNSIENILTEVPHTLYMNPTLFIRGIRSNYILPEDGSEIISRFPHSHIIDIEAGHWVHAEAPSKFYQAVNDFIH